MLSTSGGLRVSSVNTTRIIHIFVKSYAPEGVPLHTWRDFGFAFCTESGPSLCLPLPGIIEPAHAALVAAVYCCLNRAYRNKLPPDYQQNKLPPDYKQNKLPPDYKQNKLPPDYKQSKLPPDYQQNKLPPDYEHNKLHHDYEQSTVQTSLTPCLYVHSELNQNAYL